VTRALRTAIVNTHCAFVVRKASDGSLTGIAFNPDGSVQSSNVISTCGTSDGFIHRIIDQNAATYNAGTFTSSGYDLTCAATSNEYKIYDGATGAMLIDPAHLHRICMQATSSTQGYFSPALASTITGNVTAIVVGSIPTAANAVGSPRFLSLYGSTNTDVSDTVGAVVIARNGSTSPNPGTQLNRASTQRATATGAYDTLCSMTSILSEPTYSTAIDGVTTTGAAATVGAMAADHIGLGYSGNAYISAANQRVCEAVLWPSALTSTQLNAAWSDISDYYGTPAPPAVGGGTGGGGGGGTTTRSPILPHFPSVIFDSNFSTPVAEPNFLTTYGSTWGAYPSNYLDTEGQKGSGSHYNPGRMSVSGSADGVTGNVLKIRCGFGSDGKAQGAAPWPRISGWAGANPKGQLYGRYEVKMRAVAPVQGYKVVPLLWPNDQVWGHGEDDWPEGSLTGQVEGNHHHLDPNPGAADNIKPGAVFTTWHTYAVEWVPGSTKYILDGVVKGNFTTNLSTVTRYWVLQCETNISSPNNPISGQECVLEIASATVWNYA
jgi:hypothetical protein